MSPIYCGVMSGCAPVVVAYVVEQERVETVLVETSLLVEEDEVVRDWVVVLTDAELLELIVVVDEV